MVALSCSSFLCLWLSKWVFLSCEFSLWNSHVFVITEMAIHTLSEEKIHFMFRVEAPSRSHLGGGMNAVVFSIEPLVPLTNHG